MALRRRLRIVSLVAANLVVFGLFESAARVAEWLVPARAVDLGLGFTEESRAFITVPGEPAMRQADPRKLAFFAPVRFAAHKAPGTLRVVMLGESSVNRLNPRLTDFGHAIGARLGGPPPSVEVLNGGANSYGSQRLVAVARELLEYQPDVMLIYLGHNEFEELEQLELASLGTLRARRVLSHSALYRFLRDRAADLWIARLRRLHDRRLELIDGEPDPRLARMHQYTHAEVAERMAAFRGNLARILESCRARGVRVVLGTVPSNRFHPWLQSADAASRFEEVKGLMAAGRWAEADVLARRVLREAAGRHQSSDSENEIIRSLAAEYDVAVADVERAVAAAEPHHIPGETLFVDHCHLSEPGNDILLATFADALVTLLKSKDGR